MWEVELHLKHDLLDELPSLKLALLPIFLLLRCLLGSTCSWLLSGGRLGRILLVSQGTNPCRGGKDSSGKHGNISLLKWMSLGPRFCQVWDPSTPLPPPLLELRWAVSKRCFSSSRTRVSTNTALSSMVNSRAIFLYWGSCQAAISNKLLLHPERDVGGQPKRLPLRFHQLYLLEELSVILEDISTGLH